MSKPLVGIVVNWVYHFYNHDLNHKLLTFEALFFFFVMFAKIFHNRKQCSGPSFVREDVGFSSMLELYKISIFYSERDQRFKCILRLARAPGVNDGTSIRWWSVSPHLRICFCFHLYWALTPRAVFQSALVWQQSQGEHHTRHVYTVVYDEDLGIESELGWPKDTKNLGSWV